MGGPVGPVIPVGPAIPVGPVIPVVPVIPVEPDCPVYDDKNPNEILSTMLMDDTPVVKNVDINRNPVPGLYAVVIAF
ncbi:MAG: hypothetical protein EBU31_06415 [Proteobacteria bacterium]|nr:hypothetical protein [Pseudomonadota bacterium]